MKQEGTFQEVIKKALEWYTANNNGTDLDTNHFLSSVRVLGLHGKMVSFLYF